MLSLLLLVAIDLAPVFAGRSGAALVHDLREDKRIGEWNATRVKQSLIRPGSVLKPFTLAAFIEAGMYRENLKAEEALATSSNEFFDTLVARMDAADFERGYARFGLNARAPTVTLEQLGAAGRRLVARHREARLRPVFAGMEQAAEYGTARLASIDAVKVAGKTGTTAVSAMFLGYAPAERPRYLVLIHLDAGSGGGDAAPYAAKIFAALFRGEEKPEDRARIQVRLFWQNPPRQLNLKEGEHPAGTLIDTGVTKMHAPGPLRVVKKDGRYLLTAGVAREDYVTAVLAGEAGGFRHRASREAMAVAARTYAARFRHRHAEEGFDFCDTTHCQDARFLLKPRAELEEVVEATAGEMLWYEGKPAAAYYHADSGGWLSESGEGPYLKARKDAWWEDSAAARWTWTTTLGDLATGLGLSMVRPLVAVRERDASGRVKALDVLGRPADGAAFRNLVGRAMGWDKLPSRLFDIESDGRTLKFTGRGRGHGIGLAQTSAERMAAVGKSAREILAEYYPATKVGITASGLAWTSLREGKVTLWTTNPSRDRALLGQAQRQLARLEEMVKMTAEPVLRVYPSRDAFRDATGILDAVQGATRGRRVHLPPGVREGTLRHELLHAVLESNTRIRHPEWMREGLVEALLGEASAAARRVKQVGVERVLREWRGR